MPSNQKEIEKQQNYQEGAPHDSHLVMPFHTVQPIFAMKKNWQELACACAGQNQVVSNLLQLRQVSIGSNDVHECSWVHQDMVLGYIYIYTWFCGGSANVIGSTRSRIFQGTWWEMLLKDIEVSHQCIFWRPWQKLMRCDVSQISAQLLFKAFR